MKLSDLSYDDDGNLYHKQKKLTPKINTDGYPYIVLNAQKINVKRVIFMIALIDLTNFVIVNLDGDKQNNSLTNLEIMTRTECNQHHFNLRTKGKKYHD